MCLITRMHETISTDKNMTVFKIVSRFDNKTDKTKFKAPVIGTSHNFNELYESKIRIAQEVRYYPESLDHLYMVTEGLHSFLKFRECIDSWLTFNCNTSIKLAIIPKDSKIIFSTGSYWGSCRYHIASDQLIVFSSVFKYLRYKLSRRYRRAVRGFKMGETLKVVRWKNNPLSPLMIVLII